MTGFHFNGLEQSSFSYDVPDDGIAKIEGYLHVNRTSLLAERGYSMIESLESLYANLQFGLA
jgi:hypothetical protein